MHTDAPLYIRPTEVTHDSAIESPRLTPLGSRAAAGSSGAQGRRTALPQYVDPLRVTCDERVQGCVGIDGGGVRL